MKKPSVKMSLTQSRKLRRHKIARLRVQTLLAVMQCDEEIEIFLFELALALQQRQIRLDYVLREP
jgi:hypothetical protein